MSNVTSLARRRRSQTVEDAITSLHASVIAEYLAARLAGSRADMDEIRKGAARVDSEYPGFPSLVAQLDALRSAA